MPTELFAEAWRSDAPTPPPTKSSSNSATPVMVVAPLTRPAMPTPRRCRALSDTEVDVCSRMVGHLLMRTAAPLGCYPSRSEHSCGAEKSPGAATASVRQRVELSGRNPYTVRAICHVRNWPLQPIPALDQR